MFLKNIADDFVNWNKNEKNQIFCFQSILFLNLSVKKFEKFEKSSKLPRDCLKKHSFSEMLLNHVIS